MKLEAKQAHEVFKYFSCNRHGSIITDTDVVGISN